MKLFSMLSQAKEMALDPVFVRLAKLGMPEQSTLVSAYQQPLSNTKLYPIVEIIPEIERRLIENEQLINALVPAV